MEGWGGRGHDVSYRRMKSISCLNGEGSDLNVSKLEIKCAFCLNRKGRLLGGYGTVPFEFGKLEKLLEIFFVKGVPAPGISLSLINTQKFESIDLQLTHISNLFFRIHIGLDLGSGGAVDPYPDPGRRKSTQKKCRMLSLEGERILN